jgi:hypothetical protein
MLLAATTEQRKQCLDRPRNLISQFLSETVDIIITAKMHTESVHILYTSKVFKSFKDCPCSFTKRNDPEGV